MDRFTKGISRLAVKKSKFKVSFVPDFMIVYTNHPFSFKLVIQRGSQSPIETRVQRCERSLKSSDLKTVRFIPKEEITLDTTFFSSDGVPETKTVIISVVKVLPGNKDETVASATIDLRNHFGDEFNVDSVEFEQAKGSKGIICKKLRYSASISFMKPTDI